MEQFLMSEGIAETTCDVIKPRYSVSLMSSNSRPDQNEVEFKISVTSLEKQTMISLQGMAEF